MAVRVVPRSSALGAPSAEHALSSIEVPTSPRFHGLLPALVVVSAAVALAAVIGRAVALPLSLIGVIVLLAVLVDARARRIPNRLVIAGATVIGLSVPSVALVDDRALSEVLAGSLAGLILSGAPVLFVIWIIRPAAIGGGDWKLLAVLGAGVGLALPVAAVVLTMTACLAQFVIAATRRTTVLPFGPAMAIGYFAALGGIAPLASFFGGGYA